MLMFMQDGDLSDEAQDISPETRTRIANLLLHARIAMAEQEEMKQKFAESCSTGKKTRKFKHCCSFPEEIKPEHASEVCLIRLWINRVSMYILLWAFLWQT